jgi:hypothetical protein
MWVSIVWKLNNVTNLPVDTQRSKVGYRHDIRHKIDHGRIWRKLVFDNLNQLWIPPSL